MKRLPVWVTQAILALICTICGVASANGGRFEDGQEVKFNVIIGMWWSYNN